MFITSGLFNHFTCYETFVLNGIRTRDWLASMYINHYSVKLNKHNLM